MKRFFILLMVSVFVMALAFGCGKKETKETDKVPVEVKEAEQMDSTRMDSAAMETMEKPADSM